jgi:hypothetical protein
VWWHLKVWKQYPGFLVLPAVEVSTAHGHLLVYGPPESPEIISTLLGKIDSVGDRGKESSRTKMSMSDVVTTASRLGTICVAAHIDRKNTGFEMWVPGYPLWKQDVIANPGLYGIECDRVDHLVWYSPCDEKTNDGGERRKLCAERASTATTAGRARLAAVQNSEAHDLQQFKDSSEPEP